MGGNNIEIDIEEVCLIKDLINSIDHEKTNSVIKAAQRLRIIIKVKWDFPCK